MDGAPERAGADGVATSPPDAPDRKLRFGRSEWAGAFGDLGTLIPFVVAYVELAGLGAGALFVTFGAAMVFAGFAYRTPFPVQPMKAAGAIAITNAAAGVTLGAAAIHAAALATGMVWLLLGVTGTAQRVARLVAPPIALGLIVGLGIGFMLEGARSMSDGPWLAIPALALAIVFSDSRRVPVMFALLALGIAWSLATDASLPGRLDDIRPSLHWPTVVLGGIGVDAFVAGFVFIALPQLPLTLGNAVVAVTAENNRLFPDRPTSEGKVATTTGLVNLFSGALGGVPMCHGAGGMAGHVRFGARTGGAPVILGVVLLVLGLFASTSIAPLLALFPRPLLGVILFLAGLQLAMGARDLGHGRLDRLVMFGTAGLALWNVGAAFVFGVVVHELGRRGLLRL